MPGSRPVVSVQFDQKSIARTKKSLMRFEGAELAVRLEKGVMAVARLMVNPIREDAPVLSGATRRSVRARTARAGGGFIKAAKVGPTTRIGPPLIRGHRLIAWGHETGLMVAGNPFVDEAISSHEGEAARLVSQELFKP